MERIKPKKKALNKMEEIKKRNPINAFFMSDDEEEKKEDPNKVKLNKKKTKSFMKGFFKK